MLAFKKPGDGIPAAEYQSVLGRKLRAALPIDHQLSARDFE
jgi:N-acetylneuraminate synthase